MMQYPEQWTSRQRLIAMVGIPAFLALATLIFVDMPMRAEQARQRQEVLQWQQEEDALRVPSKPKAIPVATAIKDVAQKYPALELITTETSTPGTFAISGSGGYVDLYKALAELEKQLPRATWSSLAITQSNDFKNTLLHLVVSTPVEGKKP